MMLWCLGFGFCTCYTAGCRASRWGSLGSEPCSRRDNRSYSTADSSRSNTAAQKHEAQLHSPAQVWMKLTKQWHFGWTIASKIKGQLIFFLFLFLRFTFWVLICRHTLLSVFYQWFKCQGLQQVNLDFYHGLFVLNV